MHVDGLVAVLLGLAVISGCSGDGSGRDATLDGSAPASDISVLDDAPGVATDLAPSQIAGSTVPAPLTPVPCVLDDLELWTAQLLPGATTVDAVIRVRNDGDVRCDADIGRSPNLDPAIEFDVWLERGATADLIVGQRSTDCEEPSGVGQVEVAVGDDVATVATAIVTCDWWLTAFFPNDPTRTGCEREALDVVVTPDAVLIRNGSGQPCVMGGIVEVEGAAIAAERSPGPSIHDLLPGDVLAFGRRVDDDCGPANRVGLYDEAAGALVVERVPCALTFELGGGRPWFDEPSDGPVDRQAIADALNAFGLTE